MWKCFNVAFLAFQTNLRFRVSGRIPMKSTNNTIVISMYGVTVEIRLNHDEEQKHISKSEYLTPKEYYERYDYRPTDSCRR
jgi:hypothetical protein